MIEIAVVKIKARIKLYSGGRKTPFHSGYRPLFDFGIATKTSGKIKLIDVVEFYPGDEREVEIEFLNKDYLGEDFRVGKIFSFGEGAMPLGEGRVQKILT